MLQNSNVEPQRNSWGGGTLRHSFSTEIGEKQAVKNNLGKP